LRWTNCQDAKCIDRVVELHTLRRHYRTRSAGASGIAGLQLQKLTLCTMLLQVQSRLNDLPNKDHIPEADSGTLRSVC